MRSRSIAVLVMLLLALGACSGDERSGEGASVAGAGGGDVGVIGAGAGGSPPSAGGGGSMGQLGAGQGGSGGSGPPVRPVPPVVDLDPLAGNDGFALPDCGGPLVGSVEVCGSVELPCRVLADQVLPLSWGNGPALALEAARVHVLASFEYARREGTTWAAPEPLPADFSHFLSAAVDGSGTLSVSIYDGAAASRLVRRVGTAWETFAELPAGYNIFEPSALVASETCLHAALELDAAVDPRRRGPAYAVWGGALQTFVLGPPIAYPSGLRSTRMAVGPDGRAQLTYTRPPGETLYWARPGTALESASIAARWPGSAPLAAVASDDDSDGFVVHVAWTAAAGGTLGGQQTIPIELRLSTRSDGVWQEQTVTPIASVVPSPASCPSMPANPGGGSLPCVLTTESIVPVAVFGSADGSPRVLLHRRVQNQTWGLACPPPQLDCFNGPCPPPNPCEWSMAYDDTYETQELLMAAPGASGFSLQTLVAAEGPTTLVDSLAAQLGPDGHVHVLVPAGDAVRHLELGP